MQGKTNLASFSNSWYNPGNTFKRGLWYFFNLIFVKNPYNPFIGLKRGVLRMFGAKIGKGLIIKPAVNIKYPWKLKVGNNVWIGENVWIDNLEIVEIQDNVCISQGAMLLCGNHNYKKTSFDLIVKGIIIEEGAWIGAKAIVCPGVICKSHALLTVGSVAVKPLEPYSIYQGNPAVKIKDRLIL